jgi:hypothetical protein
MRTDFEYSRETGELRFFVYPETQAEAAIFAALRDKGVQPVLIESPSASGLQFNLKLAQPSKAIKEGRSRHRG